MIRPFQTAVLNEPFESTITLASKSSATHVGF